MELSLGSEVFADLGAVVVVVGEVVVDNLDCVVAVLQNCIGAGSANVLGMAEGVAENG